MKQKLLNILWKQRKRYTQLLSEHVNLLDPQQCDFPSIWKCVSDGDNYVVQFI